MRYYVAPVGSTEWYTSLKYVIKNEFDHVQGVVYLHVINHRQGPAIFCTGKNVGSITLFVQMGVVGRARKVPDQPQDH